MEFRFNLSIRKAARMIQVNKVKAPLFLLAVVSLFPFITGSDRIWREDIFKGTDRSL